MTTPVIVGRLYDGTQLVRTVPFPMNAAPPVIDVPDSLIPPRLQELDAELGGRSPEDELIRIARWKHIGWENNDLIPVRDWIHEYGKQPPADAVVKSDLVAVRYAEYQRV